MSEALFVPRFTPNPEGPAAEFYAYCARGELRFQRCTACASWRHPPRILCSRCGAEACEWAASSGRGQVYTWTVTHQALAPMFAADLPYAAVVIELEEGLRLVSALRAIDCAAIEIGLPVVARFHKVSDTLGLHWFEPAPR
ncbi:MAG: OB-fold domain-containing protein [Deltaproteobacteria bacterium]|nr:OB-fold domain-containing protein [Deltaproteobacteria bacterium]